MQSVETRINLHVSKYRKQNKTINWRELINYSENKTV